MNNTTYEFMVTLVSLDCTCGAAMFNIQIYILACKENNLKTVLLFEYRSQTSIYMYTHTQVDAPFLCCLRNLNFGIFVTYLSNAGALNIKKYNKNKN